MVIHLSGAYNATVVHLDCVGGKQKVIKQFYRNIE